MTMPWFWARRERRLSRHLPPQTAAASSGDLLEEYGVRCERDGRLSAERWMGREMSSLMRAYRADGISGTRRRWLGPHLGGSVTQALRSLWRTPWYVVTVVLVIAVSLALNAAVFAIVDGTLFKPLPYPERDRLFGVTMGYSKLAEPMRSQPVVSAATLAEWRNALPGVKMTGFNAGTGWPVGVHDTVPAAQVDGAFFDVLGQRPIAGGFEPGDFRDQGRVRSAIISYGLWQRKFGGSSSAIGQVLLDETGKGIRVAGILPQDFLFPYPAGAIWKPELLVGRIETSPPSKGLSLVVLTRLGRDQSLGDVLRRLEAVFAEQRTSRPTPALPPGTSARMQVVRAGYDRIALEPIDHALTGELRTLALAVFAAATTLVLLACLNIAGLTIARVRERWRSLVTRRSLGARTVDLVALLALENAVVVTIGALVGLAGAQVMLSMTLRLMGGFMLVIKPPELDWRVLAYVALASVGCIALVTGLSARAIARTGLRTALSEGGSTTPRERGRISIVSVQIAMALVLTVGGALVAGSLMRVWNEDSGFEIRNTAVLSLSAPSGSSAADIEALVDDVAHLPGIAHAGGTNHLLLESGFNGSEFDRPAGIPDRMLGKQLGDDIFPIESVPITHGFLEAAGLHPIEGRLPSDAEFLSGAPVVVVTSTVAREYWPGQRAVGQTLLRKGRPFEVVGVVADARFMSLDLEAQGEIYFSITAASRTALGNVLVQFTHADAGSLGPVVSGIIQHCPKCWLRSAQMMTSALGTSIRPRQFRAWLFSMFGIAALVIVGAGILGLVAMATNRRTREIGIRMALGATPAGVVRQIVREQLAPIGVGLMCGGLVAAWATRFVEASLYKTPIYDPWSWTAAVLVLLGIAVAGALIPSRRASRIDPVKALRTD
jgi:predicted permease